MTSPVEAGGPSGPADQGVRLLAVTACPTGIAHTYMAAEKLTQAAEERGISLKVETQGSIGAENLLTDNDVSEADGVIIAADKDVSLDRFAGKRVLVTGVAEGVSDPDGLIDRVLRAPVQAGSDSGHRAEPAGGAGRAPGGKERGTTYKALMNGVSHMIPFVVVGGLLIAISLALGGEPKSDGGLVIPDGSFWKHVNDIGTIGFTLMVPVLSGYIAYAIADRPALVPGMIGGWIANTGDLYDSESGAGFIGAIITGFLAGYLVRWIKQAPVPRFVQPIMPIIVIPIAATSALGLFFIYVIGRPISWIFENLTDLLGDMTGTSAALLGILLGLMIAFDMGGPVNKTAFLFGAGLVSKNPEVMGMCAAAIPVPPLGQGLATLLRRGFFDAQERETGYAALFMGFFGITEGAIPFAAARPARVIPANMLGGAVAGGIAGLAAVEDNVPHGGPIVAVLGAIDGVALFFLAVAVGTAVTGLATSSLMSLGTRRRTSAAPTKAVPAAETSEAAAAAGSVTKPVRAAAGHGGESRAAGSAVESDSEPAVRAETQDEQQDPQQDPCAGDDPRVLSGHLSRETVRAQLRATTKDAAIREMAALLTRSGAVSAPEDLVHATLAREEQGSTGLGEEIAVPHAKTDAVSRPVVGFARSAQGVEWGAVDGTPARLVFMIAVPEAVAGDEHLRLLAVLSRRLMDDDYRERLRSAENTDEILSVLAEIE